MKKFFTLLFVLSLFFMFGCATVGNNNEQTQLDPVVKDAITQSVVDIVAFEFSDRYPEYVPVAESICRVLLKVDDKNEAHKTIALLQNFVNDKIDNPIIARDMVRLTVLLYRSYNDDLVNTYPDLKLVKQFASWFLEALEFNKDFETVEH